MPIRPTDVRQIPEKAVIFATYGGHGAVKGWVLGLHC